ncbi:alpha/beta hydrolase [Jeotgalicoccus nanhaiensis]|uniref:Alpha/beta hydrolase n=1 Tax=Jeotgalicoccus nanhaiensis TaxID=568603 RepID=A0ABR9XVU8_9STAP|nr:alpha/beta hydrolase [Jeotgalicoccus nanhaiensis]MBF0753037.1 alpha/beta hydrolase [Jeotgalicoccus nanhaiensis]TFU63188.1 alpha/beta hydrolase [Jeotgalicoccus nanhaiensis]
MDSHYTNINGIKLHYVTGGIENGPVCLLLHGFPESWITWRNVIPHLEEHYKIVAVDLRGYGDSDKPEGIRNYTNKLMASDIAGILAELKLTRAYVVGHDRGARVARRMAYDYPELINRLALIEIMPMEYVYSLSAEEAAKKYWHWVFQVVSDLPETLISGKEEEYLKFLLSRGDGLFERLNSDGSWEEYLSHWKKPGAVKAALSDYRASYKFDLPEYQEMVESEDKLNIDTLLLWAENGNLSGLPVEEIWKQSINNVTGYELKNCGHYLLEESGEEVAKCILKFDK